MTSARLQNKISGMLSGWYSDEWNKTIVWNNGKLFIKDAILADEIIYNLKQDGFEFDTTTASNKEFINWETEITFK